MKAVWFRWISFGFFILLLFAMAIHSDESVGISINSKNGEYSFSGGAPPWSLAFGIAFAGLYIALSLSEVSPSFRPMPHLFRRWIAGLIDWVLALVGVAPYLGLVAVLTEYKRTGVFDWVIDRQQYDPGDWAPSLVGVLGLMFVFMPAYFVLCWRRGKPTPGACILGYRVLEDEGGSLTQWHAYLRALLGGVALLGWPCWILAYALKRDKAQGKFWLDQIFKTHAEFLT